MSPLYEMARISKSIKTESRFMAARDWRKESDASGCQVSLEGTSILELMAMVAQS